MRSCRLARQRAQRQLDDALVEFEVARRADVGSSSSAPRAASRSASRTAAGTGVLPQVVAIDADAEVDLVRRRVAAERGRHAEDRIGGKPFECRRTSRAPGPGTAHMMPDLTRRRSAVSTASASAGCARAARLSGRWRRRCSRRRGRTSRCAPSRRTSGTSSAACRARSVSSARFSARQAEPRERS